MMDEGRWKEWKRQNGYAVRVNKSSLYKWKCYLEDEIFVAGEQMMRKNNRTGKRLRLIPLILGGYAAFLGFVVYMT